jgi:peroxiredoxin
MIVSKRFIADIAPEFVLHDTEGRAVHLSDYKGKKNVILVFNRGLG